MAKKWIFLTAPHDVSDPRVWARVKCSRRFKPLFKEPAEVPDADPSTPLSSALQKQKAAETQWLSSTFAQPYGPDFTVSRSLAILPVELMTPKVL